MLNDTRYFLAYDDGNMIIRYKPKEFLKYFDKKTKTWIEDVELARMYFGGIMTIPITKEEAMKYTGGYE